MKRLVLVAAALAAAACTQEEGPLMAPGESCMDCHGSGEGKAWSFAGTIFTTPQAAASDGRQGITVTVEDKNGKRVSVRSNEAGNFYSAEKLVPPLRAWVSLGGQISEMEDTFESGSCNACHTWPSRPAYPDAARLTAP